MLLNGKLLIADHNDNRRQELKALLDCLLGIECMVTDLNTYNYCFNQSHERIDICVISAKEDPLKLKALMQSELQTAFLLLTDSDLDFKYAPNFIGTISEFDIDKIKALLRKCHAYISEYKQSLSPVYVEELLEKRLNGISSAICKIRTLIKQLALCDTNVLITGEAGVGKEIVARTIHALSNRRNHNFIKINCHTVSEHNLADLIYGTVAKNTEALKFAHGGTLFLDEIANLPKDLQIKLLELLSEHKYKNINAKQELLADVRIIAATKQDLKNLVESKIFLEDLYYQLNAFPLVMPPLRERCEDIPLLVEEMIKNLETSKSSMTLSAEALLALQKHQWPGTIRELKHLINCLFISHPNTEILKSDLPLLSQGDFLKSQTLISEEAILDFDDNFEDVEIYKNENLIANDEDLLPHSAIAHMLTPLLSTQGLNLKQTVSNFEFSLIREALRKTDGNVSKAAVILDINRTTLVQKMKKLGL